MDEVRAVAFVGLVLCHIKAWFLHHKSVEFFPNTEFIWSVNMGLPARNLQETQLVDKFRRVLWSAMLLAEKIEDEFEERDIRLSIASVQKAVRENTATASLFERGSVHHEQVGIFPEIAAQIYGYLKSDSRDPTQEVFMLVDVGGGTVDAALFRVMDKGREKPQFVFWAAAVETLGVFVLHRERLAWNIQALKRAGDYSGVTNCLQTLLNTHAVPVAVPGRIEDYLSGVEYPPATCDRDFSNQFGRMLWDDVIMAAKKKVGDFFSGKEKVTFLLCGGGRSIALYDRFLERISARDSGTRLKLHPIKLWKPLRLEPQSIDIDEYHRLSVAYGLSFDDIGDVITPDQLQPKAILEVLDISTKFIPKEHT